MDVLYLARKFTDSVDEQKDRGDDVEEIPEEDPESPTDPVTPVTPTPTDPYPDPTVLPYEPIDGFVAPPDIAVFQKHVFGHNANADPAKLRSKLNYLPVNAFFTWVEPMSIILRDDLDEIPPKYMPEYHQYQVMHIRDHADGSLDGQLIGPPMIFEFDSWATGPSFNTNVLDKPSDVNKYDGARFDHDRGQNYIYLQPVYYLWNDGTFEEFWFYWDDTDAGGWSGGWIPSPLTWAQLVSEFGGLTASGIATSTSLYEKVRDKVVEFGYNNYAEDQSPPQASTRRFSRIGRMGFYFKQPQQFNTLKLKVFFSEKCTDLKVIYSWGIPLRWGDIVDQSNSDMTVLTTVSPVSDTRSWEWIDLSSIINEVSYDAENFTPLCVWLVNADDYDPDYTTVFKPNYAHYMPSVELWYQTPTDTTIQEYTFDPGPMVYHVPSGWEGDGSGYTLVRNEVRHKILADEHQVRTIFGFGPVQTSTYESASYDGSAFSEFGG